MTSATTDRRLGLTGNKAYKTPVTTVATTNITQSGEQTVGGVAVLASNAAGVPDRVLCTGQTTTSLNGIWDVSTGSWTRSIDANGNYDLSSGTQVSVTSGTYAQQVWMLTTADPITVGTTGQAWSQSLSSGFLSTLAAAGGSALVGYDPPGASAVTSRTIFSILRERRRLTDYLTTAEIDDILVGTGSIDISAKFQLAVTDAGGRVLELPEGRIRADGMTVSTSRSCIVGAGGFGTRISAPTVSGNVFTASSTYIELRDLYIDSVVTRSGGWYVDVGAGATRFRLKNFYFDGFKEGIRNLATASATFEQGYMYNGIAATGIAIRVGAGTDISIRDVVCDQVSQLFAGIYVTATGDLTIEDVNFIHCGQGLYLAPGAGEVVASVWANNSYFDTSSRGAYVAPSGAGAAVVRCIFDECWFSSNTGSGAELVSAGGASIDGVDFNGCHFFSNGSNGVAVGAGVANVRLNGGAIAGNTSAGFSTAANVSDFSVQGVRIGNSHGFGANGYGIFLAAGTGNNFQLIDNDLRGNTTANLSDGATGTTKTIANNLGHNPVANTAITVGLSPFTYTNNTGAPATVFVTGGTVSAITLSSKTVSTATNCSFAVPHGQSLVTTWASTPAMSYSGH
jgi:hypothetical protein